MPTMGDTLAEYSYLRTTNLSRERNIFTRGDVNVLPGRLASQRPSDGRLWRPHRPFYGEGAMHTGIDISAPQGTPVHATADGTISTPGWNGAYGRCVIIDHGNDYQTWYAHLSRIDAMEGQEIRQGEILGAVGTSGRSTGAHLHYEVRVGSTPSIRTGFWCVLPWPHAGGHQRFSVLSIRLSLDERVK